MWRNWNLHTTMEGMEMKQLIWKTSGCSQKIKCELPYDPATPLGRYPREMKTSVNAETCTQLFAQHYSSWIKNRNDLNVH